MSLGFLTGALIITFNKERTAALHWQNVIKYNHVFMYAHSGVNSGIFKYSYNNGTTKSDFPNLGSLEICASTYISAKLKKLTYMYDSLQFPVEKNTRDSETPDNFFSFSHEV